jgi:hypothetical protein
MTVVFHNDELYEDLKYQAAHWHVSPSDIIAEAVQYWLDDREDEELWPLLEGSNDDHLVEGGKPRAEIERDLQKGHHDLKWTENVRPKPSASENRYEVAITPSAERDLEKIGQEAPPEDIELLLKSIADLANNPHPPNSRRIRGPSEIRPSRIRPWNEGAFQA